MAAYYMSLVFLVCFTCQLGLTHGSQDEINTMLLAKIEALEKQGQAQFDYIARLEGDLRSQNQNQDLEIERLQEHVHRQDETIQLLLGADKATKHSHNKHVHSLIKAKSRQSRLVLDMSENIVFYAQIAKPSLDNIAVNQTVVFEQADINLGGGYSPQTGVFTTPRTGIYLLATSFASYLQHHHEIHLSLRNNGRELARVVAHGDSGHLDQGSTTILATLNKGDNVYLSNIGDPDNSLGGSGYSNFMGTLLYEM